MRVRKYLSFFLTLCMVLTVFAPAAFAAEGTAEVATQQDLQAALENPDVTEIVLKNSIVFEGVWEPIVIEEGRTLAIDGQGYTISDMVINEYAYEGEGTGVGSQADYYAGFISNNKGTLTISNLKFVNANVDMKPRETQTGSSILGVVLGNNVGEAVLNNVDVDQSVVKGYTKAGLLHGFTQGSGSFTANHCAITNSEIVLEADGTDPEAAFSGVIIGYGGENAKTNGIKLENNTMTVDESVDWGVDVQEAEDGTLYVETSGGVKYGLISPTYTTGSAGVDTVPFVAETEGYQYETLQDALEAVADGGKILMLENAAANGERVAFEKGSTVTIDFDGKTFTGDNGNAAIIVYADGAEALLTGGTIVADETSYCTVITDADSKAVIEKMTLLNSRPYGNSIKAFNDSEVTVRDTKVTSTNGAGGTEAAGGIINIYNATYSQTGTYYDHNSVNAAASNGGVVNIYSGDFYSDNYGLYVFNSGGTINVYDGSFEAKDRAVLKADLDTEDPVVPSAINVYDGSFSGTIEMAEGTTLTISGGTFENTGLSAEEFQKYVKEGYGVKEENGAFTVYPTEAVIVAEINGEPYTTLKAAIAEAQEGETVKLLKPVGESVTVDAGSKLTLDLKGQTVTGAVTVHGDLTVMDSTATEKPAVSADYETVTYTSGKITNTGTAVLVEQGGALTVQSGTIESTGNIAVVVHGEINAADWATPVNSTAAIEGGYLLAEEFGAAVYGNGGELNVKDGVIVAKNNAAVAGNGTANATYNYGGTTTNIEGGVMISHIWSEGYIACGVYHPQSGELNISGGTIYADNGIGILMRNGALNMTDGTVIANGTVSGGVGDRTPVPGGYAIGIDYAKGYDHNNEETDSRAVSVTGGSFTSNVGAVYQNTAEDVTKIVPGFIAGGTFSQDPTEFLAEGYEITSEDGNFGVRPSEAITVAEVDGEPYTTLKSAIAEAQEGETVKLLKPVQESVTVDAGSKLTLDLNGQTVTGAVTVHGDLTIMDSTVTEKPAVSADYKTVTYTSGKITNEGTAVFVEQGGNLTVQSGTIESTGNIAVVVHGEINAADWATPVNSTAAIEGGYLLAEEFGAAVYGNGGELNIKDGVIVAKNNAAVAGNGRVNTTDNFGGTTTNIEGGVMISHIWSEGYIACGVYHPQSGALNISGGTIYADNGIGILMRNGALNMTDGTVIANGTMSGGVGDRTPVPGGYAIGIDYAKGYDHNNEETDSRAVSVTGGSFTSNVGAVYQNTAEDVTKIVPGFITGGTFSKDPSAFAADGYVAIAVDGVYTIEQQEPVDAYVNIAVGEPAVAVEEGVELPEGFDPAAFKDVAADGLAGAAGTVVKEEVDSQLVAEAADQLNPAENESITIVVEAYLDIAVTGYSGEDKSMTLDIKAMYQIKGTTAATEDLMDDSNTVVLTSGTMEEFAAPITITLPVPANVFTADGLYVKHEKEDGAVYIYSASLAENGQSTVTFTNPNGFSLFTVMNDTRTGTIVFTGEDGSELSRTVYTFADLEKTLPEAPEKSGYSFEGWLIEGTVYQTLTNELLTAVNGKEVTASPQYEEIIYGGGGSGVKRYSITTASASNGKISVNFNKASKGSTITITLTPDEGYEVESVTVKGIGDVSVREKDENVYTFIMPAANVTVRATFKETTGGGDPGTEEPGGNEPGGEDEWENPFTDVTDTDWFFDSVEYVYENGLMLGTSDTTFSPQNTTTRGMIVEILHRMEGSPSAGESSFEDVAADAYYAGAVAWAAENGIVMGYSDTEFGPEDHITREQMASILYRYAQFKGVDVSNTADLSAFEDAEDISEYAVEALQWANAEGLIAGRSETSIAPLDNATRAEVAAILMRFCENIVK